jgi:hypothetical protein
MDRFSRVGVVVFVVLGLGLLAGAGVAGRSAWQTRQQIAAHAE